LLSGICKKRIQVIEEYWIRSPDPFRVVSGLLVFWEGFPVIKCFIHPNAGKSL
jgi:hypothetical protein